MTTTKKTWGLLDTVFVGLLLVIFAGIVVHAPLTVWLGTVFPTADFLIKAWKEVLLAGAVGIGAALLWRRKQWAILKEPIILLIAAYVGIHLLLLPYSWDNATSAVAGLLIDLRYVVYFVAVYVAIRLYPELRRLFVIVFLAGASVVASFGVLQVFVLPPDFLTLLGYGDTTIAPYLTVDENPDYIRISSTLRGPNPLGAYAVIVLAVVAALWVRRQITTKQQAWWLGVLTAASAVILWASYSRSAAGAAAIAIGLIIVIAAGKKFMKWALIGMASLAIIGGGLLYVARDTSFVSNVVLHENETTGGSVSSNEAHFDSLAEGIELKVLQPLGAGIGSTGSASLYSDDGLIIENQYLFIAHEVGWVGLVLFVYIFVWILRHLWRARSDWLSFAVFASGIGLAVIGILLPVWVDDTVAIIWWGLAAVALGGIHGRTIHKTSKRTA